MMVLEKKPVEKNRNILGQKQRKVSKSKGGRVYYVHRESRKTRWRKPKRAAVDAE